MHEITWQEAFLISSVIIALLFVVHALFLFVRFCYIRFFRGYAVNAINEGEEKQTVEILKKNCLDECKRSAPLIFVGFFIVAVGIHLSSRYLSDHNPSVPKKRFLFCALNRTSSFFGTKKQFYNGFANFQV